MVQGTSLQNLTTVGSNPTGPSKKKEFINGFLFLFQGFSITFVLMKRLLLIISILAVSCTFPEFKKYNGSIVEKMIVPQDRSSTRYYVVFKADSLSRNVSIDVNWDTYINLKPGQRVAFDLYPNDIK